MWSVHEIPGSSPLDNPGSSPLDNVAEAVEYLKNNNVPKHIKRVLLVALSTQYKLEIEKIKNTIGRIKIEDIKENFMKNFQEVNQELFNNWELSFIYDDDVLCLQFKKENYTLKLYVREIVKRDTNILSFGIDYEPIDENFAKQYKLMEDLLILLRKVYPKEFDKKNFL